MNEMVITEMDMFEDVIGMAKKCGIAYYVTPEGTHEMHCTDEQLYKFAIDVARAAIAYL